MGRPDEVMYSLTILFLLSHNGYHSELKGDRSMVAYKVETRLERDGEVTLNSLPFQAGERVEITVLSIPDPPVREKSEPVAENRTPQMLREEYKALIHKKLHRTLSEKDAARLEAVRAEINQLDLQSESWMHWEQRASEVDREIADLRRELEALPDA